MADFFPSQTTTVTPGGTNFPTGLFGQTAATLQGMGNPYTMSAPQWGALEGLIGAVTTPRPDPVAGNPAWQAFLDNQQNIQGFQSGFSPAQASAGSAGFSPSMASYSGVGVPGQPGVTTAQINTADAQAAAAEAMSRFASPQVRAAMQAAGMGRSGAEGEAIANAGASLQLPISLAQLQSQAQANQLDAQIKARQGETSMLARVQADLQAQLLTARSASEYNQIAGQLASVNAQMQTQASIANAAASTQAYQANLSAQTAMGGQLASLAGQFPQLYNQQYLSGLQGAQIGFNASNFPQSLDIANQTNQQTFLTNLLRSQSPGGTTVQQTNPGILGSLGIGEQTLGLIPESVYKAAGTGISGLVDWLTQPNDTSLGTFDKDYQGGPTGISDILSSAGMNYSPEQISESLYPFQPSYDTDWNF